MLTPAPRGKPTVDPTLSVVLPNYNHASLIRRAVGALRAANRLPDEILIIDDASTDQSLQVIKELAAGWNIIRVLANSENQGSKYAERNLTPGKLNALSASAHAGASMYGAPLR